MKHSKTILSFLFLIFLFCSPIFSENIIKLDPQKIPLIPELTSRNDIFKEYTQIVDENYKYIASGKEPVLVFFKCTVPKDMNLLSLAARCNIPYETIATLNKIETNGKNISGKTILLPTAPGLFIIEKPTSSLQIILKARCSEILQKNNLCYNFETENFVFLQNQRWTPTERAYFLDTNLGLPIDTSLSWISSSFGRRKNPFYGEWKDHKGTDFAAETGTPVYAVQSGTIDFANYDTTFGLYIILKHNNSDSTSVYAHLNSCLVKKGQKVQRGEVIGYVGQTGMATGPHLHFEIRFGGIAEDPEKVLPINNKK